MAKKNYNELYKAQQELRHINPMAVYFVGQWMRKYANKTSLNSLAELLMSWSASPPQTAEQANELKEALKKITEDK